MDDPALAFAEGGDVRSSSSTKVKYLRSRRTSEEASIIDMLQVLLTLLSDNDTAAALLTAGCPRVEAQGLVKQIKHLMRLWPSA